MPSQPLCVNAILFWSFERESFGAQQSVRSWAFAGLKHVSLRFVLPPCRKAIQGLRLQLTPCPGGTKIQSISFAGGKSFSRWRLDDEGLADVGTIEAAISPYAEPTSGEVESALIAVRAKEGDLRRLRSGGVLEIVVAADFTSRLEPTVPSGAQLQAKKPAMDIKHAADKKSADKAAVARHLQEMHNEVNRLSTVVSEVYSSNSWRKTQWCREAASEWRNMPYWRLPLLISRQLKVLVGTPLKSKATLEHAKKVDVIVPVHGSYESVKNCIQSVLNSTITVPYELIVVDDASPQESVKRYLRRMASDGQIVLLENSQNLGFTATVNRGMELHHDSDVVLLNSDTIVSNDWLDRLQRAAYSNDTIGSVTPFSNNASICSYPKFGEGGEMPGDYVAAELDEIFSRVNERKLAEIPTGVGFCFYIKRECLKKTGLFDAETFPGYGEENDFCERAIKLGWKHVLAADTFVYHEGGTSYGELKKQRMIAAYDAISKVHPQYQSAVRKFSQLDPLRPLRERVDLERLKLSKKPIILSVLHGLAGGTLRHVVELEKNFGDQADFLSLRVLGERVEIKWLNDDEGFVKTFLANAEWADMICMLKSISIQRVHVHHFHGLELKIRKLIDDLALPYDFTVHDFYAVCPQGWLCDHTQRYCGQPDEDGCNNCLKVLPHKNAINIQEWRERYSALIENAQRVFVPSVDAHSRIARYLPPRPYIITPHIDSNLANYPEPANRQLIANEHLRIVVLGLLNNEKGAGVLDECAQDAIKRKLPIEFHFLGAAHQSLATRPAGALISYGIYNEEDLQELLNQVRPHLAWFPAQCPETYSYTLSACLEAGLPVAAPDIGAFPERLSGRTWTWVRDWQTMPSDWNNLFVEIMEKHFRKDASPPIVDYKMTLNPFMYVNDYLTPVLQNFKATLKA